MSTEAIRGTKHGQNWVWESKGSNMLILVCTAMICVESGRGTGMGKGLRKRGITIHSITTMGNGIRGSGHLHIMGAMKVNCGKVKSNVHSMHVEASLLPT